MRIEAIKVDQLSVDSCFRIKVDGLIAGHISDHDAGELADRIRVQRTAAGDHMIEEGFSWKGAGNED